MTGGKHIIYLASKSPRRRAMLRNAGLPVRFIASEADETLIPGEAPRTAVLRIARQKFRGIERVPEAGFVLTADTVVAAAGAILGKPSGAAEAGAMLRRLSGATHSVYTGYYLYCAATGRHITGAACTRVTFRKLGPGLIRRYIATGSPLDKAGAYGIQDPEGPLLIEKISGCYYNVVGLPLAEVYEGLLTLGYREQHG